MSGFSFSMTKRREGKFFLKDLILLERIFRFEIVEFVVERRFFVYCVCFIGFEESKVYWFRGG